MKNRNEEFDKFIARQELDKKFQTLCKDYWGKYLMALDDHLSEVLNRIEGRVVGDKEAVTFLHKESKFNDNAGYFDGVWKHVDGEPSCVETVFWKGKPIVIVALFEDNYLIKSA